MEVDLPRSKEIVLVFVIFKAPNNQTKQLVLVFFIAVMVEEDYRFIILPLDNRGLLDKPKFLLVDLIDQTFEARLELFFLIAKDKQIVLALVLQVLQIDEDQFAANPNRVEIFEDQVFVVDAIECDAFLLDCCYQI